MRRISILSLCRPQRVTTCGACVLLGIAVIISSKSSPGQPIDRSSKGVIVDSASTEKKIVLETETFELETLRTLSSYTLLMRNANGNVSQFAMPATPWDISSAAAATKGKAIVVLPSQDGGDGRFGASKVFVLGSRSGTLLDSFGCEMPSLSPDGRFLAFIAYYPQHFAADDLTSNFVMLYDLKEGPGQNRGRRRIDFPLENDPSRQVGAQLYPLSLPRIPQVGSEEALRANHSVFDITWSPDSTKFAFFDEAESPEASDQDKSEVRASSFGNLRLSPRISRDAKTFLVVVSLRKGDVQTSRIALEACPLISGVQCRFDLKASSLGQDGVTVTKHVGGRTSGDYAIHLPYENFEKLPGSRD